MQKDSPLIKRCGYYALLGLLSGYATKRVGRSLLLAIGGGLLALEVLGYHQWAVTSMRGIASGGRTISRNVWQGLTPQVTKRVPQYACGAATFILALIKL